MHVPCVAVVVDVVVDVLVSVDVVVTQVPHSTGHAPLTACPTPRPKVHCFNVKGAQSAPSSLPLQVRASLRAAAVGAAVHVSHLHGTAVGTTEPRDQEEACESRRKAKISTPAAIAKPGVCSEAGRRMRGSWPRHAGCPKGRRENEHAAAAVAIGHLTLHICL